VGAEVKNAKTTIAGILTIALPILSLLLKFLNGEPITGADLVMVSTAGSTGAGLLYARDAATVETTIVQPLKPSGPVTIEKTV
jgi:hypothetical protein